jgi:carbon monoxide dehydrogenase subunit G
MKRKILIGVGAAVALFALVVASRPANFHIERSITIHAPPDAAFSHVNDFHAWVEWSPYEKLDSNLKRTYGEKASGVGATYAWAGEKAGEGRMTIERSVPSSEVLIKLELIKPMAATNTATFTFAPTADGTRVTWAMDGRNGFVGKAFSLFLDVDKLVGADFERGLVALKKLSETTSSNKAAVAP